MALSIKSVTKTAFGSIKGNVDCYTGGNVDEILTDLATQIDNKLASAMHYKGAVAALADLDSIESKETGDVYNVTATGKNYAWSGSAWDELSGVMDLSAYKTDTENEAKYEQKANLDTDVGTAGYLKEAGVNTLISTALADYTKTADLGDLASKDTVAKADLAQALADELDAKATTVALEAVDAKFDDYTKTTDLGTLATKSEVAESDLESTLKAKINAAATSTDLTTLAGRVTTAESDIDTAESDIDTLESKVSGIAGVTKATKTTVTLYELYDMVAAIIDAAGASS